MKKVDYLIEYVSRGIVNFWYIRNTNARNLLISILFCISYFLVSIPVFFEYCSIGHSVVFMTPTFIMFGLAVYFYLYSQHLFRNRVYKSRKSDSMNFDAIDNLTSYLANREKELQQKASWLNTLLSSVTHGLLAVNEDGKVAICNTAASDFLEYETCMELKDVPITDIFPEIFPSSEFLKKSFENPGQLDCIHTNAVTRDNNTKLVELCVSKEMVNDSLFLSIIINDIVEHSRREENLIFEIL